MALPKFEDLFKEFYKKKQTDQNQQLEEILLIELGRLDLNIEELELIKTI